MDLRLLRPLLRTVLTASLFGLASTPALSDTNETSLDQRLRAVVSGEIVEPQADNRAERGSWGVPVADTAGELNRSLRSLRDDLARMQGQDLNESAIQRLESHVEQIKALHLLMTARFADIQQRLASSGNGPGSQQRALEVSRAQAELTEQLLTLIDEPVSEWRDGANEGWLPERSWYQWQSASSLEEALVLLDTHLKAAPVTILRTSSLPLRNASLAPRAPVSTPTIDPVYARLDGASLSPDARDLASTEDAPLNDEILRKARELEHDYIRIYEFVRNEISLQWYAGAMKGAVGTLRQGSGNDVDQASLLIALFRASGLPSRYVHGVVELSAEQVASTLGLPLEADLGRALSRAGVAFEPVIRGGRVELFRVEHTWVTAHVPYTNYRGAVVDASGKTWLPLMPAVKGADNGPSASLLRELQWSVDGTIASHLEEPQALTPTQQIRTAALNYLEGQGADALSYEAMLGTQQVQREELGLLPSTAPVEIVAVTAEAAELAAQRRQRLRLIVRTGSREQDETVLDQTLAVSNVASERFTLSYMPASIEDQKTTNLFGGLDYVPPYLIKLRPQLKVNGRLHSAGTGVLDHASPHYLEIRLLTPAGEERIAQTLTAGSYHAIGVAAQAVAEYIVEDDPADTERTAAALLNRIAQSYNDDWNQADAELAGLLDVTLVRPFPSISIVSNVHTVHDVLDEPHSMEWQGVSLDAAFRVVEPLGRGDTEAARDWMRLSGLQGSNLEARVFEEHFKVDSISADRAIALASQAGIALIQLDKSNIASVLPSLDHPAAVLEDVQRWVDQGLSVQLPQTQLAYQQWLGSAWRVEDPRTGAAGYFIAGGLAGGQTAQGPEFWTLGWLADALRSPNSTEPNPDPLAAASISKLYYSDGQSGDAGHLLDQPIAVLVRDIDNRPVANAPVTFVSIAGGGDFGADGQHSVEVLTDELGVAKTPFTLGKRTDANSVWVLRKGSDRYATLAGSNVIEVSVQSGLFGQLTVSEPFTAIAYPGKAVVLVNTQSSAGGNASTWAGNIESEPQDEFGNVVSNTSVTFSGIQTVSGSCPAIPDNPVLQARVFNNTTTADGGLQGCPQGPMLGECGTTSLTVVSSSTGASVGVLLGNVPRTNYPVSVSSAGIAEEILEFAATGSCAPAPSVHVDRVFLISKFATVKVGEEFPKPHSITVRYDVREPEYDSRGNVSWLPGGTYFRTTADVQSSLSNGGHAGPNQYMGDGNYQSMMRAGPNVGSYAVSDRVSRVAYPELEPVIEAMLEHATADNNIEDVVENLRDQFFEGVSTAPLKVFNAIEPTVIGVQTRDTAPGQDPNVLTLDAEGRGVNFADIYYRINPEDFTANRVEVELLKNGAIENYWVGPSTQGSGAVLLNRGVTFDVEDSNQLQVVVNRGKYEVRSDLFDVPIKQALFQHVDRTVKLSSDVDVANQRICSIGGKFEFTLSEEARVSLTLVNSNGGVFEHSIVSNELYSRGKHSISIDTSEVNPGRYDFTLEGTSTRTGDVEVKQGLLLYRHTSRDNLPLGHTLVKGVNVHTGSLALSAEDLQVPGRGTPLQFIRSYSSAGGEEPGPLGLGWSHNYDSRIIITPCGEVIISGGDGSGLRFVDDGDGGLRPLKGHHGTLIADNNARTFDFYSKDGTRYHYRQMGVKGQWFLEFIQDTNGNATKLGYDPNSLWDDPRVSVVEDSAGRTLKFSYDRRYIPRAGDSYALLTGIVGPDGLSVDYDYDDEGSLIRATREGGAKIDEYDYLTYNYQIDPDANLRDVRKLVTSRNGLDGSQVEYAYHQEDAYWQVTDDQGVTFYSPRELISEVKTPDGITAFQFSTTERSTQVTNERGYATTYRMNSYGSVTEMATPVALTTTEWDLERVAMRSQTTQMSAGESRIEYEYDEHGNKTLERVSDGTGSLSQRWTYLPQGNFNPPYIKNRPDSNTDRNGETTNFTYDANGNLTRVSAPEGAVTSHTYAANGDRLRTIDPNGNTTRYQYDAHGYPEQVIDALGGISHFEHDMRGRQIRRTDANGNTTVFEYDTLDRETQRLDAEGGVARIDYDDSNNRRTETDPEQRVTEYQNDWAGRVLSITNALGDKQVFEYDANGNKTLESNWHGNGTSRHDSTFSYDAGDRLQRRIDPLGRQIDYEHDAVGNLLSETLSGTGLDQPQVTTYTYDLLSRRTSQTPGDDSTWLFEYDGEGNKTAEVDAEGRRSEFDYDGLNRLIEQREPLRTTRFSYDQNSNLLSQTLINGSREQVQRVEYDALNRRTKVTDAEGQSSVFDYDAVGNLVSEVNARLHRTTYGYDALNRRIRQQLPPSIVSEYSYDKVGNLVEERQPNGNVVETVYDALNQPLRSSDSLGLLMEAEYDANGNRTLEVNARGFATSSTYNALNQLTEQELPGGDTLSFTYDVAGNVLTSTDARGFTTSNAYDVQNRLIQVTDPEPFAYTQTYTYDRVGNQLTQTDRRGHVTTHEYDQRNRVILTTSPAPFNFTQRFEYDAADNLIAEVDRRGTRTEYSYDRANRRLSVTKAGVLLESNQYDAIGNIDIHRDANNNRTSYIYNERSLLITESRSLAAISHYQYDAMGNRTQRRDPEGRITRWTFDARNRQLTEERDGTGAPLITRYEYDGNGNRTQQTRPLGNAWTYTFDERDRLQEVSDPDSNTTTYAYDGNGNRLSQKDARGHTTHYDYDALNRQTSTQYVDGASEFQDYDANGNRTLLIDAKGQTFGYHHDSLDRLTQADYPATGLAGELTSITYQYDANNNTESITEQRQGQDDRVTLNRYDAFDRLEAVIDGFGKEQRYSYDANGNRTSLRDPDEVITRYSFDELNRIASVNNAGGTTTYSYDRSSRKTRVNYPNGSRADYRYDNLGRLELLSNTLHGATVSQFGYQYDANGNRTEQRETNGQGEELTTYVYDNLDRLTEVTYPDQTVSYGYDAVYNRTSERTEQQGVLVGDKTQAYDNRNRLTSITDHQDATQSVTYGYDANGNQTSKTENGITTQFVYDARDKLVSLVHNGISLGQYRYDYQGMRVEKTDSDASVVRYSYDGQSVLTQFDEAGDTLAKYDYGPDQLLSLAHRDQGRQFYLFDALGSIANLTRTDGTIQARYQYDTWGNLRQQTGDSWNSFGFTGHERDKETGLYYFKARYYDPQTARFLTQDSYLGEGDTPPSLHRYLYAYGNPGVYIDPDGYCAVSPVEGSLAECAWDWLTGKVSDGANTVVDHGIEKTAEQGDFVDLGGPTPTLNPWHIVGFGAQVVENNPDLALGAPLLAKPFLRGKAATRTSTTETTASETVSVSSEQSTAAGQSLVVVERAGGVGAAVVNRPSLLPVPYNKEFAAEQMRGYGITLYDSEVYEFLSSFDRPTLGALGQKAWLSPADQAMRASSRSQLAIESGLAERVVNAAREGGDIYATAVPMRSVKTSLPSAKDAGANDHFLDGVGHTAVRGEGFWMLNKEILETTVDGGKELPAGSMIMKYIPGVGFAPVKGF